MSPLVEGTSMFKFVLAMALTFVVTAASAAEVQNYREKDYTGADAGYLVMSISQTKATGFLEADANLLIQFRSRDHKVAGYVQSGPDRFFKLDFVGPDFKDSG